MEELIIPPCPTWYSSNALACAEDNTLIYASYRSLTIIYPIVEGKTPVIKILSSSSRINSVIVNPNWNNPNKYAVTFHENKYIKLWDISSEEVKMVLPRHTTIDSKLIGGTFAGQDKVISVSENGVISIWKLGANEITTLKDVLGTKIEVSCISSCPYQTWKVAFGFKDGKIVVADLRQSGKVLFKVRVHYKNVMAISWCPTPYNIFEVPADFTITNFSSELNKINTNLSDSLSNCSDKSPAKVDECEFYVSESLKVNESIIRNSYKEKSKPNPWVNLKFPDDDEIEEEKLKSEIEVKNCNDDDSITLISPANYLQECTQVKNKLQDFYELPHRRDILVSKTCSDKNEADVEFEKTSSKTYIKSSPQQVMFLASISNDGSIYILRGGTDGRIQMKVTGPSKAHKQNVNSNYFTLHWIAPQVLLSSNKKYEVLQWDLTNTGRLKTILNDHTNIIFCITSPPIIYSNPDPNTWTMDSKTSIWTFARDKFIRNTRLCPKKEIIFASFTLNSVTNCLEYSPVDPTRIAVGDDLVKIWDLSRQQSTNFVMSTSPINYKLAKITAIAWHPEKETSLVCGTSEGKIYLVNTCSISVPPKKLTNYFITQIQKLQWAPNKENKIVLYVVSEGKFVYFDLDKLNDCNLFEVPVDPIYPIDNTTYYTNFSWKPDNSMLAIGTKAGAILIYSRNFEYLTSLYLRNTTIRNLAWHLDATAEDEGQSLYCNYLAVCASSEDVFIYDLSKIKDEETCIDDLTVGTLAKGHGKTIRKIDWSPHEGGKLVSVGEDGVAEVWDVPTKKIISTFVTDYMNPITTVLWSPVDKDHIIIGSKNSSLQIYNLTKHPPKDDLSAEKSQRTKLLSSTKKVCKKDDTENDEEEEGGKNEKILAPKSAHENLLPNLTKFRTEDILENSFQLFAFKINDGNFNSQTECRPEKQKYNVCKFFGDKSDMIELLSEEQTRHNQKNKFTLAQQVSLWKGDIQMTLKDAIQNQTVTPFLLSIAPIVSPKLWKEACEVYAKKLSEQPNFNPVEAASYYLACHKVEEAVQVLLSSKSFREAYTLAKSRLNPDDSLIKTILREWGNYLTSNGAFELASQCFIVLEDYEQAAKCLYRRTDLRSLELALELAKKCDNKQFLDAVLFRYRSFSTTETSPEIELPTRFEAVMKIEKQKDSEDIKQELAEESSDHKRDSSDNSFVSCNSRLDRKDESSNIADITVSLSKLNNAKSNTVESTKDTPDNFVKDGEMEKNIVSEEEIKIGEEDSEKCTGDSVEDNGDLKRHDEKIEKFKEEKSDRDVEKDFKKCDEDTRKYDEDLEKGDGAIKKGGGDADKIDRGTEKIEDIRVYEHVKNGGNVEKFDDASEGKCGEIQVGNFKNLKIDEVALNVNVSLDDEKD